MWVTKEPCALESEDRSAFGKGARAHGKKQSKKMAVPKRTREQLQTSTRLERRREGEKGDIERKRERREEKRREEKREREREEPCSDT